MFASTLVAFAPPAVSVGTPILGTTSNTVWRTFPTNVVGRSFQPGAEYEISVDRGMLGPAKSLSATVQASPSNGTFSVAYLLPSDVPLSVDSIHLTATLVTDPTVVASTTVPVGRPNLGVTTGCPGGTAGVVGDAFPDGTYVLSSDRGTISNTTVTANQGWLFATIVLPDVPGSFGIRATDPGTGQTVTAAMTSGSFRYVLPSLASSAAPWRTEVTANCFAPNEIVTVSATPGLPVPTTLAADSTGAISLPIDIRPGPQPNTSAGVTLTGRTSGQYGWSPAFTVPGTTLFAGQSLSDSGPSYILASSTPGYTFNRASGGLVVMSWSPDGSSRSVWSRDGSAPESVTTLQMQTDGNLVLRSASGAVSWSTGTAGIGRGNRVTMRDDGNVVMTTADGRVVWSTKTDRILGKDGYLTLIEWTASHDNGAHRTVITGVVRQWNRYGHLNRGRGRAVYLKAYERIHGRSVWRTVAVTRAGSAGQFTISLQHPTAFYTIDVPRGGEIAAGHVSPFRR